MGEPEPVEWLRPTSGRTIGLIGLGLAALLLVLAAFDLGQSHAVPTMCGAVFLGVIVWAAMLRPRVGLSDTTLVLRNMLETVRIPLAAVEELALRQVLAVRVGEKRFVSPALGRTWRALVKGTRPPKDGKLTDLSYADVVEDQLRSRIDTARSQSGVRRGSAEQAALGAAVRREPAWPEIAGLVAAVAGFVISLVL